MRRIAFIAGALLTIASCPFTSFAASTSHQKTVNILMWWGYMNDPQIIHTIEKSCKVKISYDEYYSNDEFLRRWRTQKNSYDIIIFSNTIYNIIRKEIPHISSSNLAYEIEKYNPIIKKQYLSKSYPKNVVYFFHSLTGFMYNAHLIDLSKNDSIATIFQKANNKLVVVIDDPVEARKLLGITFNTKSKDVLSAQYLNQISSKASIYIGNGLIQIYKDPEFSFAYTWSGEAINYINNNPGINFDFLIHPHLSYISSDLLAQVKNNKESTCVSRELSSKKILSLIENSNNYFSPYTDIRNIKKETFKKIYQDFLSNLPNLTWVEPINPDEFDELNTAWDLLKTNLINNKEAS